MLTWNKCQQRSGQIVDQIAHFAIWERGGDGFGGEFVPGGCQSGYVR